MKIRSDGPTMKISSVVVLVKVVYRGPLLTPNNEVRHVVCGGLHATTQVAL